MWDWMSWFLVAISITLIVLSETKIESPILRWISVGILGIVFIRITFASGRCY